MIRQNLSVFLYMYSKLSPESGNNLSSLNSVAYGKKWMITHRTLTPLRYLSASSLWVTVTLPQPWDQTSLTEIQRSLYLIPRSVYSMGSQEDAADLKVPDFQMMGFSFCELKLQRVKIHNHTPKGHLVVLAEAHKLLDMEQANSCDVSEHGQIFYSQKRSHP